MLLNLLHHEYFILNYQSWFTSMAAFHLFILLPIIAAQEASKSDSGNHYAAFNFCTDIIIPPRAVNASINGVAEFTCTGVANSFTWEANGLQLDNGPGVVIQPIIPVNETLNIRMSIFRIAVVSIKNATNITCTAFRSFPLSS